MMPLAWPVRASLWGVAAFVLVLLYGPLFLAIFFSFFAFKSNRVQWDSFSLSAYAKLMDNQRIIDALQNTFVVGVAAVARTAAGLSLGADGERATVHAPDRSRPTLAMMRPSVVIGVMLLVVTVAMGTAAGRAIDAGRLGLLPLVLPDGDVQEVVFLFSDRTGWNADLDRAAARLSKLGAAVLEVDLPGYLARLVDNENQATTLNDVALDDGYGVAGIDNDAYIAAMFKVGDYVALIRSAALVSNAADCHAAKSTFCMPRKISSDRRERRFRTSASPIIYGGNRSASGLSPSVTANGVELQFCRNPAAGLSDCGNSSSSCTPSHSAAGSPPSTGFDQSNAGFRRGTRPLYKYHTLPSQSA